MPSNIVYQKHYGNSWGLIIGVNAYQKCNPLGYACNDAAVVAQLLREKFGFPAANITLLLDGEATRSHIMSSFMSFTKEGKVSKDDRIIVFFAGHGYTAKGSRGEVGFLVPVDGDTDAMETLVRWDDLTRNADLILAKHMLFIMDACYGGLAVSRYLPPGSMRFLRDMLQRYSRQVLTAGKADEVVADSGGPRHGHSIFTGHFLDAVEGAAAGSDGIITANKVMAYVYDKVSKDNYSNQTPHYGFVDGDGDFIFNMPLVDQLGNDLTKDNDMLIAISPVLAPQTDIATAESPLEKLKTYLSEPSYRIKLDDLVSAETRRVISRLGSDDLSSISNTNVKAEFSNRLKRYEEAVGQLQAITAMLGKWGTADQRNTLESVFARLAEVNAMSSGAVIWLGFRWYPITLLMYSSGIASLNARNFENLASVLTIKVRADAHDDQAVREIIIPAGKRNA